MSEQAVQELIAAALACVNVGCRGRFDHWIPDAKGMALARLTAALKAFPEAADAMERTKR